MMIFNCATVIRSQVYKALNILLFSNQTSNRVHNAGVLWEWKSGDDDESDGVCEVGEILGDFRGKYSEMEREEGAWLNILLLIINMGEQQGMG